MPYIHSIRDKPVVDMHHDKPLKLSIQSLEETNYQSNTFDFVTSLSVIEHGVDIHKYFMEMNRILKRWTFVDVYRLLARKNYQHKTCSL